MSRFRVFPSVLAALHALAAAASAEEIRSIAVVTQVQGAVFYRTSVTFSNGNPSVTTPVSMLFSYRSPVDSSFQQAEISLTPALGPHSVRFFDDIIQEFKNRGAIRAADANAALFGTLLVNFEALNIRAESAAVARTYSPVPGGGTLGIAYAGRCFCETGSVFRVLGSARSGVFGNDGSTRANLGIVNEGFGATDMRITYYNGDTGAQLKQFLLSAVTHRVTEENEVVQLNNIFSDPAIPANVHTLVIQVEAVENNVFASAYVVQLDNTTNDGSFFFLEEESGSGATTVDRKVCAPAAR